MANGLRMSVRVAGRAQNEILHEEDLCRSLGCEYVTDILEQVSLLGENEIQNFISYACM